MNNKTVKELVARLSRRNDEDSGDDDVWENAREDARDNDVWENAREDTRAEPAKKPTMINRLFNWAVKPVKTAVKNSYDWAVKPVKTAAKNSYDWIIKHTPEPLRKAISEKADAFKAEVESIYNNYYKKQQRSERDIKISESAIVIKESKTALKRFARQYVIDGVEKTDAPTFLDIVKPEVVKFMSKHRQIKMNLVLVCEMERHSMEHETGVIEKIPFVSRTEIVLEGTDVAELFIQMVDRILESFANFQMKGSNWRLKSVIRLEINTGTYKPLKGKSYIPLPKELAAKKAIINIKNEDDECFKWCVTRALNPIVKHSERITEQLKEHAKSLNWDGIKFPVAVDENVISKFERNNNLNINIFGYDSKEMDIFPLIISKNKSEKAIDLLLISNGKTKHYCLIKNFNKLASGRTETSHNKMYYCKRCLTGYRTVEGLQKHNEYCSLHGAQKIVMPAEGATEYFKHYCRSMRVPFVIYADFESFIEPISSCNPNPATSFTHKFQKHTPSAFCYHVVCSDGSLYSREPVVYSAKNQTDDVAQLFVNSVEQTTKDIYNKFKFSAEKIFTKYSQSRVLRVVIQAFSSPGEMLFMIS